MAGNASESKNQAIPPSVSKTVAAAARTIHLKTTSAETLSRRVIDMSVTGSGRNRRPVHLDLLDVAYCLVAQGLRQRRVVERVCRLLTLVHDPSQPVDESICLRPVCLVLVD